MNEECVANYGDAVMRIAKQMKCAPKDDPKKSNESAFEPFIVLDIDNRCMI